MFVERSGWPEDWSSEDCSSMQSPINVTALPCFPYASWLIWPILLQRAPAWSVSFQRQKSSNGNHSSKTTSNNRRKKKERKWDLVIYSFPPMEEIDFFITWGFVISIETWSPMSRSGGSFLCATVSGLNQMTLENKCDLTWCVRCCMWCTQKISIQMEY